MVASNPYGKLIAAGVDAWTPRPPVVRSAWCEEHLRLPSEFAAAGTLYDLADRPYLREVLDAIDDPAYTEIVFVAVPQIGKTTILEAIAASQGEIQAAPMMLAGPDEGYAREERTKIYRICEQTKPLQGRIPPERLRNDRWIDLGQCLVYLAWSGSPQRLSGRACQIVLCSEVDRWTHSIELAKQRTKAFWRGCLFCEGTPIGASPAIWPLYQGSDRRTFRVPCPTCGAYQELRFFPHKGGPNAGRGGVAGLQDESGRWRSPEEARLAAHYLCEQKGCRIEGDQKRDMVRRGVWVPEGCRVDARGRVQGTPANPGRRAGFTLNRLYAPTVTFGDAAEAWLQLRDSSDGVQSFFNDWLGLPYEPRGETPRWKDLGQRLAGDYPRGSVPRGAYFLTCGADVQADRVYWVLRAWGDHKTSWLVDWGCFERLQRPAVRRPRWAADIGDDGDDGHQHILASDLDQLGGLLTKRWPVAGENPCGLSALAIRLLGVDRGYRPTDVDRFVRSHPGGRVRAVFGDHRIVPGALYRAAKLERNAKTGELYPEGTTAWGIDTAAYKTEIADRWTADRSRPGAWWLPQDVLEAPDGEDYLRQVTAERRSLEEIHGRKVLRWLLAGKATPNHDWDCEVYAAALADMVVGGEWEAARWPWARKPSPPPAGGDEPAAARPAGEEEQFSAR